MSAASVDVAEGPTGQALIKCVEMFIENDLDLDLVTNLSDNGLEKLGIVSMGHRKKLPRAIELLRAQPASTDRAMPKLRL